jgi:hypothetical protein
MVRFILLPNSFSHGFSVNAFWLLLSFIYDVYGLRLHLHPFWPLALHWGLNYDVIDFVTNALYSAFLKEKLTVAQVVKYSPVFFGK